MVTKVLILSVPYCEPIPPVAPVLLAACLESKGIPAVAADFNIALYKHFNENPHWPNFKNFLTIGHLMSPTFDRKFFKQLFKFTKSFLNNLIKLHHPTHIGLSIFTSESLDFGQILSYIIRRYYPDIIIIAGGKGLEVPNHDNVFHYQTWIEYCLADVVVIGDAESAIVDVVKNNLQGVVTAAPQNKIDLDEIPLAKWEDYDLNIYNSLKESRDLEPYLTITSSKGCVRQCTFCDVRSFWPQYIFRDPVKVADEIIFNYKNTGIKLFKFTDNLINGSISNFRAMNEKLVSEIPNTIHYDGFAIFRSKHQMPEDDFRLASVAGNNLWSVGVESGSEKIRYEMKKKFSNDDLDWSARMLAKYNIQQYWLLMVGYPSETEKDFDQTKKLLTQYQHLAHNNRVVISVTPTFMVLKNSPLLQNRELAEKYGIDHLIDHPESNDKFWTSKLFLDNTYPERSKRFKELVTLAEDLGYSFSENMPVNKWKQEIAALDIIYEQQPRIFSIHSVS